MTEEPLTKKAGESAKTTHGILTHGHPGPESRRRQRLRRSSIAQPWKFIGTTESRIQKSHQKHVSLRDCGVAKQSWTSSKYIVRGGEGMMLHRARGIILGNRTTRKRRNRYLLEGVPPRFRSEYRPYRLTGLRRRYQLSPRRDP